MRNTGLSVINTENNIYQEKQTGHEAIKRARVVCMHAPEIVSFWFCLSGFDGVIVTRMLWASAEKLRTRWYWSLKEGVLVP